MYLLNLQHILYAAYTRYTDKENSQIEDWSSGFQQPGIWEIYFRPYAGL